ncbi:hypothetical protein BDN70DRAFT_928523 [Pholiota conissans]|uniref:Uncharacterized protein n=1 Tax=Pholiota conissans TaxID=109636 RepID=A0A9P5ZB81_9AGAR|nr:hypothetical protein BDN70DRAFT_928523 [Pholiota conissans]
MRVSIPLFITLLLNVVVGLVIPLTNPSRRSDALYVREGLVYVDAVDDVVFVRSDHGHGHGHASSSSHSPTHASAHGQAPKAKASGGRSKPNMAKMSSVARVNKALTDFKAGASPAQRAAVEHAYRNTKGLPRLDAKFHIKGSRKTGKASNKYSGKDVHGAVIDAHWEAERLKTASKRQKDASTLKSFKNLPHREAKFGTKKPLDHVKPHHGPLSEFHLPNKHPNAVDQLGPARIIVENAGTHHVFRA